MKELEKTQNNELNLASGGVNIKTNYPVRLWRLTCRSCRRPLSPPLEASACTKLCWEYIDNDKKCPYCGCGGNNNFIIVPTKTIVN